MTESNEKRYVILCGGSRVSKLSKGFFKTSHVLGLIFRRERLDHAARYYLGSSKKKVYKKGNKHR